MHVKIPYESPEKRFTLDFELPDNNIVGVILPKVPLPLEPLEDHVVNALSSPIAGPKFTEILGYGRKLTIIVDNQFRPTPAHKILPPLLDIALDRKADINLIFACGAVPPLNDEEILNKLGSKVVNKLGKDRILNNEARKRENYVFRGITSFGTPVWIHKIVASAEVVVGIGLVQAEPFAGYGGGGKIVLPGVSSIDTIEANHRMTISPKVYPGALENPVRQDIEEAADLAKLDFILNVVMNINGDVVGVFTGEHRQTFRKAVEYYDSLYRVKVPFNRPADVTITGTFWPTDHLYFHTNWGVANSDLITRDGGTIVHASPSPGYRDWHGFVLMDLMKDYMPPTRENHEKALRDILLGKKEMWCGCIWYKFYEILTRKDVVIITEKENISEARNIGLEVTNNIDEALKRIYSKHGRDVRIAIMPYGKWTLPTF
ncbi:MAG: nickel-dependent lactate racemase [Ignisphaera sp.]